MTRARRAAVAALAALACAQLVAPAVEQAQAKPNIGNGSGSTVTCPEYGGGKPGDQKTLTETTVVNGMKVTHSYTVICGGDGNWHQTARVVFGGASLRPCTTGAHT